MQYCLTLRAAAAIAAVTALCSAYGIGFVEIPETGACIKIGGSVTVESTINRAR